MQNCSNTVLQEDGSGNLIQIYYFEFKSVKQQTEIINIIRLLMIAAEHEVRATAEDGYVMTKHCNRISSLFLFAGNVPSVCLWQ